MEEEHAVFFFGSEAVMPDISRRWVLSAVLVWGRRGQGRIGNDNVRASPMVAVKSPTQTNHIYLGTKGRDYLIGPML